MSPTVAYSFRPRIGYHTAVEALSISCESAKGGAMTSKHRAGVVAIVVAMVLGTAIASVSAQTNDPRIGTWKLNVAKSKYAAGTPNKIGTTKIEAAGAGIKVTVDSVGGDGTKRHWTYTANTDGKDVPITGNNQYGDVVSVTRVDANTTRQVYKNHGKVTLTQTSALSADGKTRTVTTKGTDARGQAIDSVAVYDKQ
jgi:hypothetical protein